MYCYGKLIKNARLRAGLSQKEVAKKVGVADTTISSYELCKTKPEFDLFVSILKECNFELLFINKNNNDKKMTLDELHRDY